MDGTANPIMRRGKKERTLAACAVSGTLTAAILVCGLALVSAIIAYRNDNPSAWITPLAYASSLLAAFGGGFTGARMRGRQGLFCGILTGVGVLLIFALGLMIFSGDSELQAGKILLSYALIFIMTVLGGILGGARTARTHRRRRR